MRVVVNFCDEQREFEYAGTIKIWGDLIEKVMKFLKITQFEISIIDVGGTQIGHHPNRLSDKIPDDLNQDVFVVNVIARGRDENGRVVPSEFPDLFEIYQIEQEDERLLYGGSSSGGVQIPIFAHAPVPAPGPRAPRAPRAPGAPGANAGMAGFNVMRDALMDLLVDEMERAVGEQYDEYDDYSDADVEIPLQQEDAAPPGAPPAYANVLLGAIFAGGGHVEEIRVPAGLQELLQRLMQGAVGAAGQQMSDVKVVCKPEDVARCVCCNYAGLPEETRAKSTTCNVCLEDFTTDSGVMQLPDCNHVFHKECVEQWLTTFSHKCPVCREPLGEGKPLI